MADKAEKKPDAAATPAAGGHGDAGGAKKKGGLLAKTPVLLGGAMVIEAAVLFGAFKMFGGSTPPPAAGAELASPDDHGDGHGGTAGGGKATDKKKLVELPVLDFKAPNKLSGRTFLFDVSIYVVTRGEHQEPVKQALKDRDALIKDRVRTIVAQSDPEKLMGSAEPGLETLRRQVKHQLDEIIGEGMVVEVLVPRCIPFRADY